MASATIGAAGSTAIKQACSATITSLLSQYFPSTLNREQCIVQIIMGLIQQESSFNPAATGPVISPPSAGSTSGSTMIADYLNSNVIVNIETTGNSVQRSNVAEGQQACGLMQVMGCYLVKGASKATGMQFIETYASKYSQPGLVTALCINPGESPFTKLTGSATISNQILAGLVVLDDKYRAVKQSGSTFTIGPSSYGVSYPTRMQCALRGYIGLGSKDQGNGSSPVTYVQNVYIGGSAYAAANGTSTSGGAQVPTIAAATASGPPPTIATVNNLHPIGC